MMLFRHKYSILSLGIVVLMLFSSISTVVDSKTISQSKAISDSIPAQSALENDPPKPSNAQELNNRPISDHIKKGCKGHWSSESKATIATISYDYGIFDLYCDFVIKPLISMALSPVELYLRWFVSSFLPEPTTKASISVTNTWTNAGGDGLWSNDANWNQGHKPQAGEDVRFDATSTANCIINEPTATLASFTMATGYTGTVSNSANCHITTTGDILIQSGTLTSHTSAVWTCGGNFWHDGGTITSNVLSLIMTGDSTIIKLGANQKFHKLLINGQINANSNISAVQFVSVIGLLNMTSFDCYIDGNTDDYVLNVTGTAIGHFYLNGSKVMNKVCLLTKQESLSIHYNNSLIITIQQMQINATSYSPTVIRLTNYNNNYTYALANDESLLTIELSDSAKPTAFRIDGLNKTYAHRVLLNGTLVSQHNAGHTFIYFTVATFGIIELFGRYPKPQVPADIPNPPITPPVFPLHGFSYSVYYNIVYFYVNKSIPADSYIWFFGDGTYSNETNPVHRFDKIGTYTVRLVIIDEDGFTFEYFGDIAIVSIGPPVSFDANGMTIVINNLKFQIPWFAIFLIFTAITIQFIWRQKKRRKKNKRNK